MQQPFFTIKNNFNFNYFLKIYSKWPTYVDDLFDWILKQNSNYVFKRSCIYQISEIIVKKLNILTEYLCFIIQPIWLLGTVVETLEGTFAGQNQRYGSKTNLK